MTKTTENRKVAHPLEDIFEIESGTTEVEVVKSDTDVKVMPHETYDPKDSDIEQKLQVIATAAMDGYDVQVMKVEEAEDERYTARMMEVANGLLSTALSAVKEMADIKKHKDKLVATANKGPSTVKNNLTLVGSRTEILKKILQEDADNQK
jgi:hypothetical protein